MAKMPKRTERDGPIAITRVGSGESELLELSCTQDGEMSAVRMSEYNAWRAFGLLAFFLKIRLPDEIADKIKL